MTDAEHHSDIDLAAFLAGDLTPEQRFRIASELAGRPEAAAEVMAQLRLTEGLRLALQPADRPALPSTEDLAIRLERRLRRGDIFRRLKPLAAAVLLFAAGWGGHAAVEWRLSLPGNDAVELAEAALDAQSAVALRLSLGDAPKRSEAAIEQMSERVDVALPVLPADWKLVDVQVVATPDRPGLAAVIDTPDMGRVMLFSVAKLPDGTTLPLKAMDYRGWAVAMFEKDDAAYVLVDASGNPARVGREASRLLNRLN